MVKGLDKNLRTKIEMLTKSYSSALEGIRCSYSVEVYNDRDARREPDTVGVTLFFPSKKEATHVKCATFSLSLNERDFGKQVRKMEANLLKKAGQ